MSRRVLAATVLALTAALPLAGCSTDGGAKDNPAQGSTPQAGSAEHGPTFPECGGVSDATIGELTQVSGLVNTAKNSVGCQWLLGGGIIGPHFSFTSFRGSPIGRERKVEELTRDRVEDVTIEGYPGFVAVGSSLGLGDSLCEVGIQFDDDFIEWSINFASKPFPDACNLAKELARQSIVNAKK